MVNVAVVGSINIDHISRVEMFPKLGETIIAESYELIEGGKGANQAASMSKLGVKVQMFGKVGDDIFGRLVLRSLNECNVNVKNVIIDKENSTGAAFINVNKVGDNTIVVAPGANSSLTLEEIKNFTKEILKNDIIILQMEIPKNIVCYIINLAKKSKKMILLNLAPAVHIESDTLNKVDYLVINESELEFLTNIDCSNIKLAIKKVREFYHNELIVTLGAKGVAYSNSDYDFKIIPTFNVVTIDRTGAGDAFIGGLVYGLTNNKNIEDCIYLANAVGSYATTILGAQKSFPNLNELNCFLSEKAYKS